MSAGTDMFFSILGIFIVFLMFALAIFVSIQPEIPKKTFNENPTKESCFADGGSEYHTGVVPGGSASVCVYKKE